MQNKSLLAGVDGAAQASKDLGTQPYHACAGLAAPAPGGLFALEGCRGEHHLSLGAIGRLSWGPSSPDQLRSLQLSQLKPERASEMPLGNGNRPGAGERAVPCQTGTLPLHLFCCKWSLTLPEATCKLSSSY